ncbi:MAG: maltose ABC transporter permease MalF [Devosia sp.]|nr:maltose ABC transporter permease MalF [Devosia sp.]
MTAPALSESPPAQLPRFRAGLADIVRYLVIGVIALGLMYFVWGLYLAGEPLFAVVVMALMLGIVVVYGARKFYTARFVFPAVTAVLIFIALPVLYTSYVGFTNFGARNLLTFDRVTAYHMNQKAVDRSTERPFALLAADDGYRLFLPGAEGGLLSEIFELDGTPVTLKLQLVAVVPDGIVPMRDVVKFRSQLGAVTAELPDGSDIQASGLRSFAKVTSVYERQDDGVLLNTVDGSTLTPDDSVGFYRNEAGQTVAPGWRVHVGLENFRRVLFNDGIRQPMLQIFLWTVTFATLSMVLTFSVGILLASVLQWEHLRGKAVYRILLILPYAVPAFISILVFRGLFNQNFGEINLILDGLFGVKPNWGTDPNLARAMTLIVNTWLGYPYMMLLGMGYLQSVPAEHYKAAALEGAGPVRTFFSVTLPQILPPFVPLLISNFAFNFNNVVLILLLTRGLPDIPGTQIPAGQTDLLGSFTYRISFQDAGQNFGLAGAISTLIFIVVGIIAYANFVALRRAAEARGRG